MMAKRTPEEMWRAVETRIVDEEIARLEGLSDDEVRREVEAEGAKPEELHAMALAIRDRARASSASGVVPARTPEAMWKATGERIVDEEIARLEALSDDEVRREVEAEGVKPEELHAMALAIRDRATRESGETAKGGSGTSASGVGAKATGATPARVINLDARRKRVVRWVGIGILAVAASIVGIIAVRGRNPRDMGGGNDEGPVMSYSGHLSPRDAREYGLMRCAQGNWRLALQHFDEAKAADPSGDNDPRIQSCRQRATAALAAAAAADGGASAGDR